MSQENQNIQEEPHKRRVRYKGKYPRNYKEKYKELNPEKYQDTIEKVIRKGSTPIFCRSNRGRPGLTQH